MTTYRRDVTPIYSIGSSAPVGYTTGPLEVIPEPGYDGMNPHKYHGGMETRGIYECTWCAKPEHDLRHELPQRKLI